MKQVDLIFFTIVLLINPCLLVLSQNAESCNSIVDFNEMVNFDTTAMFCQNVWTSKDYVLRVSSPPSNPPSPKTKVFQVGNNFNSSVSKYRGVVSCQ